MAKNVIQKRKKKTGIWETNWFHRAQDNERCDVGGNLWL